LVDFSDDQMNPGLLLKSASLTERWNPAGSGPTRTIAKSDKGRWGNSTVGRRILRKGQGAGWENAAILFARFTG
jgi:hypothetical protein